jgi:hypothetical protein
MKRLYNKQEWILGQCQQCGRLNYVEPHGTTAACTCSTEWTEHASIPYNARDASGLWVYPARVPFVKR